MALLVETPKGLHADQFSVHKKQSYIYEINYKYNAIRFIYSMKPINPLRSIPARYASAGIARAEMCPSVRLFVRLPHEQS